MELWIRAIKNKQIADERLKDVFEQYSNEPTQEQDIDEFIFNYDRTDENFIDKFFATTNEYCNKSTSPQQLCENFVSYYIGADRISVLAFECVKFIKLLTNSKHANLEEMTTKIENLQKFFETNKDKCDEFVINFEESEFEILEPRLRSNIENKSTVSKKSHKLRKI